MTNAPFIELVRCIHDTPTRVCLVVSGAGTSALASLFSVAGASRTVIEAQVPYSSAAVDSYLGSPSKQYVSREQALSLAEVAYQRASSLSVSDDENGRLVGLSCTAAIATDRARRGENRIHVAWFDGSKKATFSLVLKKGAREREAEEAVCSAIILNALADACEIDEQIPMRLVESEIVERRVD